MLAPDPNIPFADPERAAANLAHIEQRLPGSLHAPFSALLIQTPAPDDAVNFLERFLRPDAGTPPRVLKFVEQHPAALHYLLTVFSYSRFLSETLLQQPELITTLLRPPRGAESSRSLERGRTPEDLSEEFARFDATSIDIPPAVVLARFKRREYLRIMLRDVLKLATLAEITLELSQLADLLLDRALQKSAARLALAYGAPQYADSAGRKRSCELTIVSLGKLGGEELNYNSDIDLMFLYAQEGITTGGSSGSISNHEFFVRQAQAVLQLITESTPEGAVFRVDLRLRPQGGEGELAISLPAALDYYRTRAREWELQSLIRARGSAGDAQTARSFLKEVRPLVYQREFRLEVVEAVLNAREQITRTLSRRDARRAAMRERAARARQRPQAARGDANHSLAVPATAAETLNVKLSPGGIRDIEFLAQCLQRLYGGEDAWLQAAPTLVALQRLHDKGHLSGRDFNQLAAAYQLLRTIEHRLQLRDGLQRHEMPTQAASLDRLARRCGIEANAAGRQSPGAVLLARVVQTFDQVREIYTRQLARQRPEAAAQHARPESPDDVSASAILRLLEQEYPGVTAEFARITAGLESANYLRRGLNRYLNSALLSPAFMARLELNPSALADASSLFDRSDLAVDWLSHHPEEIERVGLSAPPAETLRLPFAPVSSEQRAEDLRRDYRRSLLRELSVELLGEASDLEPVPFPFLERFTELAEGALRDALALAAEEASEDAAAALATGPLAVLALGRIGSREMSIGSDADLMFIVDGGLPASERARWRRITERFVQIVGSHTREGVIFAVDTRLRPRGTQGELTPSIEALTRYLGEEAAAWEAITFLKLRTVAGNPAVGDRAVAAALAVLRDRFGGREHAAALAADLRQVRTRLDQDAGGPRAKGRLKKMPGGFYDIEYVLGYLAFAHSTESAPGNTLAQIAALDRAATLEASQIATLRETAILYRAADHAARLITGRPLQGFPEPALAERITRLMRQWGLAWQGDLRSAMSVQAKYLRALYLEILVTGVAGS